MFKTSTPTDLLHIVDIWNISSLSDNGPRLNRSLYLPRPGKQDGYRRNLAPSSLLYNQMEEETTIRHLGCPRSKEMDRVSNADHCSKQKVIYRTDFLSIF